MRLRLYEELLLLALHDKKGTNAFASMLDPALGGAIMAELMLEERIEIQAGGKRGLVTVVDRSHTGDPILDGGLDTLDRARRRGDPQTTVMRLARRKKLRAETALSLCRRGVLRATEAEVLLLFRRKVYPTVNPEPELALVGRIRAVLEHGEAPDERTAILIGLAASSGALGAIYDRKQRKALRARLATIREATAAGSATRAAIDALQSAIAVMSIVT